MSIREMLIRDKRGGKRKGAGRKPGNPPMMEKYWLRVPQNLHRWLNHIGPDTVRSLLQQIMEKENGKNSFANVA